MTEVERIANAVMYEGYSLYPYRPSAIKNRQRWNFGLLHPKNAADVLGGFASSTMQTQCLVRGGPLATIEVRVRFLQSVGSGSERDWQEVVEREVNLQSTAERSVTREFQFEADSTRGCQSIWGSVSATADQIEEGLYRFTILISNLTPADESAAPPVMDRTMISTHTILSIEEGDFVSLLEPPADLQDAASDCKNIGTWPVLAGDRERARCVLSSPIILYDYPQVAAESPGDLFDGGEIDEILTLRILTMTDDEKAEMRNCDERTRELLERTELLPPEHLARLHGVLREAGEFARNRA